MKYVFYSDYGPVESGTVPEDPTQQFEQQVGEFQKINSVLVDGGDRYGASAVTFDSAEELVWIGNQGVSYAKCNYCKRLHRNF